MPPSLFLTGWSVSRVWYLIACLLLLSSNRMCAEGKPLSLNIVLFGVVLYAGTAARPHLAITLSILSKWFLYLIGCPLKSFSPGYQASDPYVTRPSATACTHLLIGPGGAPFVTRLSRARWFATASALVHQYLMWWWNLSFLSRYIPGYRGASSSLFSIGRAGSVCVCVCVFVFNAGVRCRRHLVDSEIHASQG